MSFFDVQLVSFHVWLTHRYVLKTKACVVYHTIHTKKLRPIPYIHIISLKVFNMCIIYLLTPSDPSPCPPLLEAYIHLHMVHRADYSISMLARIHVRSINIPHIIHNHSTKRVLLTFARSLYIYIFLEVVYSCILHHNIAETGVN